MNSDFLQRNTIAVSDGVRALPVVHGSVEFSKIIRELFLYAPPVKLLLELPESMTEAVNRAVPFIEDIPVISTEAGEDEFAYHFIMEPLEPIVEALRNSYEHDIPCRLIDISSEDFFFWSPDLFPDTYALNVMTPHELYSIYTNRKPSSISSEYDPIFETIDRRREIHMADQIRNCISLSSAAENEYILIVCGIRHLSSIQKLVNLPQEEFLNLLNRSISQEESAGEEEPIEKLLNREERIKNESPPFSISFLSRDSSEVLGQPGYYNAIWNQLRSNSAYLKYFNRVSLQRTAYRNAVDKYERESGELVPRSREKLFFRFARNWSIVEKKLIPDTYKMVMAAKGFGNDNFARIMYDVLAFLPPVKNPVFPEKKITLDDMYRTSRLIRFRMKLKKNKRPVPPPEIKKRFKREKYPGEWKDAWDNTGICSYPPEDIIIEEFGNYLQSRAKLLLTGSESRTVPFSSSLLDGIDYRETIRNYHQGKIFVKDEAILGIDVGSVVIIFDENDSEFNWKMVWWGEHNQESDMAFYASPPGSQIAGPGIFRCQYGGLLLTHPPGRLHDIWTDEYYQDFTNPADRLLVAALEYNEKKAVVHLAKKPPHPKLISLAGRMGQKIIYIPITTIDPVTLGRVRRFHVLDSRERRNDAGDFIW